MMAIADVVTSAVDRSVARVARATRHALERIAPEAGAAAAPRPARKSKGWRKHVRATKGRERDSRI